jgi:uncharacterized membrane protein
MKTPIWFMLLLILVFVIGIAIVSIPFFPTPASSNYGYSTADPKSDINNLNNDGKNMVIAGSSMMVISFILLAFIFKFDKN